MINLFLSALKPRAAFHPYGVGYWTVRSFRRDGWLVQGVGMSLDAAFSDWYSQNRSHP